MQLANQPLDDVPLPSTKFHPSGVAQAVNVLWFSSLILSLFAALFGIFVKQWLHTYSNWSDVADPREAVLVHEFYRIGRERWHVSNILATLPLLLQLALLFFVTGLVTYLWTLNTVVAGCLSVLVVAGVITALVAIVLPVYYPNCPYKSPLGLFLVRLLKTPHFLSWKNRDLAEVQGSLSNWADGARLRPFKEACALVEISPTARGLGPKKELLRARVNEMEVHHDKSPLELLQTIISQFAASQPQEFGRPEITESMLHMLDAIDSGRKVTMPAPVIQGFVKHVAETRSRALRSPDAIEEHLTSIGALANCVARRRGTPKTLELDQYFDQLLDCFQQWRPRVYHEKCWVTVNGLLQPKLLLHHPSVVYCAIYSPDGTRIVSGSSDETVRVWDASTGAVLRTLEGHTSSVWSVAFSPDETLIVSSSGDQTGITRIWDASTGAVLHTLEGHTGSVHSIAISLDGTRIVSGSRDRTMRIWDASTGAVLRTLKGHTSSVWSVAFSPDETRIVSGSGDQTVRVWDAGTGAFLRTLEGHTSWVRSVAFSPDGTRIVSGSDDRTVRVWDASTGAVLRTLKGHTDYMRSVAFSPDGTRIVSGSDDETVRVWDASTGAVITTLKASIGLVYSVAFSPDGTSITAKGPSGNSQTWNAPQDFPSPTDPPVLSSSPSSPIFRLEDGWIVGRKDQQATAQRLFWVVPDRRGKMSSQGHHVVLWSGSGTMTLLDFTGMI
jgi:hypothetical protein